MKQVYELIHLIMGYGRKLLINVGSHCDNKGRILATHENQYEDHYLKEKCMEVSVAELKSVWKIESTSIRIVILDSYSDIRCLDFRFSERIRCVDPFYIYSPQSGSRYRLFESRILNRLNFDNRIRIQPKHPDPQPLI